MKSCAKRGFFTFCLLAVFSFYCRAQPCKTGAHIISSRAELLDSIRVNPATKFVRLQQLIPGLVLDIRYATTNNFTKTILYYNPVVCMRSAPAEALKKVQEELNKKGLGLKVYDAYRPFSVTCTMWRLSPDRRYTANPRRGSFHNRGTAVDLTLINLKTGKELDMGTGYDSFTDTAHHDFAFLPADVMANRRVLKNVMWKYGFNFVPTEWWHYHWRDKNYDVVDVDFGSMD